MPTDRLLQVLLQLLGQACVRADGEALSPASFRVACAAVADIIVQSYKEWPTWKADARQIVEASFAAHSSRGAVMVRRVYSLALGPSCN
jgi:hypothetical protein